jgi:Zn-dependent M32 family carboxypeptidase
MLEQFIMIDIHLIGLSIGSFAVDDTGHPFHAHLSRFSARVTCPAYYRGLGQAALCC